MIAVDLFRLLHVLVFDFIVDNFIWNILFILIYTHTSIHTMYIKYDCNPPSAVVFVFICRIVAVQYDVQNTHMASARFINTVYISLNNLNVCLNP